MGQTQKVLKGENETQSQGKIIIELFGLSNSGKSVLKKELAKRGYKTAKFEEVSAAKKLLFLGKSFLLNPARNLYLFTKANSSQIKIRNLGLFKKLSGRIMRNSYLASVLAKEEWFKILGGDVFTDEYSFQAIFMILQKKASEQEIKNLIAHLPQSDFLILFDGNRKLRQKAYKIRHPFQPGTLLPGSRISQEYGKMWMDSMEHNFGIIKQIVENYPEEKIKFRDIVRIMRKINAEYKRKNKLKIRLNSIRIYRK